MANDNNKIKNLVDFSDDDPTSEFEVPDFQKFVAGDAELSSEVGDKTFDVDQFADGDTPPSDSVAALKNRGQEQARVIEELRFELENAQGQINSLEREVVAREEIANNISHEVRDLNQKLAADANEILQRATEIDMLKRAVKEAEDSSNERARETTVEQKNQTQIIERYQRRIEEQAGLIASNNQEMRDFREQIERTERYADALRAKLQTDSQQSDSVVTQQTRLEKSVLAVQEKLNATNDLLTAEREKNNELLGQNTKMEQEFEQELRQVRFELSAAQETISSQDSVNGELASDLTDNREFRQALESQLHELQEKHERDVAKLQSKSSKARQKAEEYEQKIQAKDKAISALMTELANHTDGVADEDIEREDSQLEEWVESSDLLDRKDDGPIASATFGQDPRVRVARLLIGHRDGKELRFPLFKDRLTIGRTANNDIQLNVQYISRRHAVIVTDNDRTRVVDWGSKNGVFVNQKRIAEKFLESGDVVTIGTTKFTYEERIKR